MTLTIDLPPDVERALKEKARRVGQSVSEFATVQLAKVAHLESEDFGLERKAEIAARLTALERIGSYDNRARAGLPPLSEEACSRESIYEGRDLG
jgi:hypothetical protein